jgi:hypothetical protein
MLCFRALNSSEFIAGNSSTQGSRGYVVTALADLDGFCLEAAEEALEV